MHLKSTADKPPADLVLEQLPNGQQAWLKPERERRYVLPQRFWLTDRGRRALAKERLFGPSPIVADVA